MPSSPLLASRRPQETSLQPVFILQRPHRLANYLLCSTNLCSLTLPRAMGSTISRKHRVKEGTALASRAYEEAKFSTAGAQRRRSTQRRSELASHTAGIHQS